MSNELRIQKIYDNLRRQISGRLIRALGATEDDLATLSLSELINTLFLMHGDGGSTGNFSVSFGAALKLIGQTMMWREPETTPPVIETEQRIN